MGSRKGGAGHRKGHLGSSHQAESTPLDPSPRLATRGDLSTVPPAPRGTEVASSYHKAQQRYYKKVALNSTHCRMKLPIQPWHSW
jgi:hypothetical protein